MPGLAPAIIAALIGAATTATTTGLELSGAFTPSTPKPPPATTPPLTKAQNLSQQSAVSQALPNEQSLTGGSLSPEATANYGALQTGLGSDPQAAGNIQAAINQYFGLGAPGTQGLQTGSTGGSNPITDLVSRITASRENPLTTTGGEDFRGLAG